MKGLRKKTNWGKFAVVLSIVNMIALTACSYLALEGVTISGPSKELIAKMAGRRAGHQIALADPDAGERLLVFAEVLVANPTGPGLDSLSGLINELVEDDPLLAMEITDLLSLIKIEGQIISDEEKPLVDAALAGFIEGLQLGGAAAWLEEKEGGMRWVI